MTIIHPDNNVLAHDESHYLSGHLNAHCSSLHSLSHNPADNLSAVALSFLPFKERIKCIYWVRFETQWPPVILSSWHLDGNTQDDSHPDRGGREEKLVSGLLEMIKVVLFRKGLNA